MKKLLVLMTTLLTVTILTGCGEKKLSCTKSESESGFEMQSSVAVSYNSDDSVNEVKLVIDIAVPEEYASKKSDLVELYKQNVGEDAEVVETKDGVKVTMTGDESLMEEINDSDEDVSYDALKKTLTDDGYSCK